MAYPSEAIAALDVVASVIRDAAAEIATLPPDYFPLDVTPPQLERQEREFRFYSTKDLDQVLREPGVRDWIVKTIDGTPGRLADLFLQSTNLIAQTLEMFGAVERAQLPLGLFPTDLMNRRMMNLMSAWGQIGREVKESGKNQEDDPMGMRGAIMKEMLRHQVANRVPFGRTLTTLLGPDALLWLTSDSESGQRKLQVHEFMRTNWCNLWFIETQVEIEQELLSPPRDADYLAKSLVALSWTALALASCFPPRLFLGEVLPHLSSEREGGYTVSVGLGTHTFVRFDITAWWAMLRVLAAGLFEPLLNAADMMWIAAALARVRTIASGIGEATDIAEERFALFLSHRGRDSKRQLSTEVCRLPANHGVFLDCLTLPHGVINRWFIYGALARTETAVVVDTPNYSESDWCRKELWFAEALAENGLTRLERLTVAEAILSVSRDGSRSSRLPGDKGLHYSILPRILSDIDYWARKPNLHSLRENGYSADEFDSIQKLLRADKRPDEPDWVASLGAVVLTTLGEIAAISADGHMFDLWATALQYAAGAFACTSTARSKMAVRAGIDQLNSLLRSFIEEKFHLDPVFHATPAGHLALLAAACAVDLAGFRLDLRLAPALVAALDGCAGFTDGVLLLDVRKGGITREYRVRLAALIVRHNFGSIGIVQDAHDPVHNTRSGDLLLEVLPCVTLYPGMDAFQSVPLSTPFSFGIPGEYTKPLSSPAGPPHKARSIGPVNHAKARPPLAEPPVHQLPDVPREASKTRSNDQTLSLLGRGDGPPYLAVTVGALVVIGIVIFYFFVSR